MLDKRLILEKGFKKVTSVAKDIVLSSSVFELVALEGCILHCMSKFMFTYQRAEVSPCVYHSHHSWRTTHHHLNTSD